MYRDYHLSATLATATLAWAASFVFMVIGVSVDDLRWNAVSLWLVAAGAILSVRRMVGMCSDRIRDVFELGRESRSAEGRIRSL